MKGGHLRFIPAPTHMFTSFYGEGQIKESQRRHTDACSEQVFFSFCGKVVVLLA